MENSQASMVTMKIDENTLSTESVTPQKSVRKISAF